MADQPVVDAIRAPHELAVVELLGAVTYGQLRAFEVTAHAIRFAPSARDAQDAATFAAREHGRYEMLRDRLLALTDLGAAVMDRQRKEFDDYFDDEAIRSWRGSMTLFAVGLPLVADFIRAVAPRVADEDTRGVLLGALAKRAPFEQWATEQLRGLIPDVEQSEEVRHHVAALTGRMLTGFQRVIQDTDALSVLFGEGDEAVSAVRDLAVQVLGGHRRRMAELGLEESED